MTLPDGQYSPIDAARHEMTARQFRALFPEFSAPSWQGWNAIEDAAFGMEPSDPDLVRRVTGRDCLTIAPVSELWAVVGRGGGKSRFAARLACFFACGRRYRLAPGEQVYVGVFGPDRKQAALTLRYIRGLLRSVPALEQLVLRETVDTIELSTGVALEVITANSAAPRGRAYCAVILEEAAFLNSDDGELDRELVRAVRPALARVPGAMLVVISSPYAMRGELYRMWSERYGRPDPDVLIVQADTLTLNPAFSRREVERGYREDPAAAAAEYGAQFRADLAVLFDPEVLAVRISPGIIERTAVMDGATVAHFDGATGGGQDDAALSLARPDGDGGAVQIALRRWHPPFSPIAVVDEAAVLLRAHAVPEVQGDRFAPAIFADLFAARGIGYSVCARDTSQNFIELLALVNAGLVRFLDDHALCQQLTGLTRHTRAGGRDQIGHRPNAHDDLAAATAGSLVLAARGASEVPLMLLFSSASQAWEARHQPPPLSGVEPATCTKAERAEMWQMLQPLVQAFEAQDEAAIEAAADRVEAFLLEREREDPASGRRLRALVERISAKAREVLDGMA